MLLTGLPNMATLETCRLDSLRKHPIPLQTVTIE